MFRAVKSIISMAVVLVIFATLLAPALQDVISNLQSVFISNQMTSSVVGDTTTVLFLGMPLLLMGGIILLGFLIAVGIRGTSFT